MTGLPDWLKAALPEPARHAGLAIAQLGTERNFGRGGFKLTSPAFGVGEELDPCFSAQEEDAVAPPLEWNAPPPGTQELILIAEDGSSAGDDPVCHWLVWGLKGQKGMLLEGETPPRAGKNAKGNSDWLLPDPPEGETRQYVFQLFATELPLTLMPGATRADLLATLEGSIIASTLLVAPFTGSAAEDEGDWAEDDI